MPWSRASASGLVRSRNHRSAQHRLPEAGQRPAAPRGAAAAPLGQQQLRDELHQFPGDVKRGTIGDHVEPSAEVDLVVRPLLLGLHAHFRAARFVRVSARMSLSGQDKARLSEPISLRSPHCAGFGVVNDAGLVPDENTVFPIASMSKSFVACAALLARDRGALSLEDPITSGFPSSALRGQRKTRASHPP